MELMDAPKNRMRDIARLYKTAFPKNERAPFRLMKKRCGKGTLEILSIEEEGFLGFAILFLHGDMALLEYFAVNGDTRGKGVGSGALALIRKRYPDKRIFLTIEALDERAENYEMRVRRKGFYERNGFRLAGIALCMFGVEMELMTDGSRVSFDEYCEVYERIVGKPFMRILNIREIKNAGSG